MAQFVSLSTELETLNHVLRLVEAFRAFDADNDGQINTAELGGIMGSLGYKPSDQDIKSMMQNGDKNRDGMLSIEEFLDLNTKDLELDGLAASLRRAFRALNHEGEQTVTGEELFDVLANFGLDLSIGDCKNIIASIDADGDGAISFEDFKVIINSL